MKANVSKLLVCGKARQPNTPLHIAVLVIDALTAALKKARSPSPIGMNALVTFRMKTSSFIGTPAREKKTR